MCRCICARADVTVYRCTFMCVCVYRCLSEYVCYCYAVMFVNVFAVAVYIGVFAAEA